MVLRLHERILAAVVRIAARIAAVVAGIVGAMEVREAGVDAAVVAGCTTEAADAVAVEEEVVWHVHRGRLGL